MAAVRGGHKQTEAGITPAGKGSEWQCHAATQGLKQRVHIFPAAIVETDRTRAGEEAGEQGRGFGRSLRDDTK